MCRGNMSEDLIPLVFVTFEVTYEAVPGLGSGVKESLVTEDAFVIVWYPETEGGASVNYAVSTVVVIFVFFLFTVIFSMFYHVVVCGEDFPTDGTF